MSRWDRRAFNVTTDLRLDPKNVRLGLGLTTDPPQGDLIQNMFGEEDALELARVIVRVGWLTHEQPIVLEEAGRWVVIEGNRRISALKALHNPRLVPAFQAKLDGLVDDLGMDTVPETIECIIAPSRDEANRLIATLHTSTPRKPWRPLRQAQFFARQVDAGKTVATLIEEYPGINVKKFIETAEMQALLTRANYEDDDLLRYAGRANFPTTTLDRLTSNPAFRELAQIEVDGATGHVSLAGEKATFDRLAEKVVGDIKAKRIDTRRLNSTDSETYNKYMAELQPYTVKPAGRKASVAELPPPSKPKAKRAPSRLAGTDDLYPIAAFPSTERLIREISGLPYKSYPNATLDLTRTLLEKSIKAYAEDLGQGIGRKRGAFVYLDDALLWLDTDIESNGGRNKKALRQVITRLRSNDRLVQHSFKASKELLDATNHNHHVFAVPKDVVDMWDSMITLLKYVLRDRADK
jgi:hypothetical protein